MILHVSSYRTRSLARFWLRERMMFVRAARTWEAWGKGITSANTSLAEYARRTELHKSILTTNQPTNQQDLADITTASHLSASILAPKAPKRAEATGERVVPSRAQLQKTSLNLTLAHSHAASRALLHHCIGVVGYVSVPRAQCSRFNVASVSL